MCACATAKRRRRQARMRNGRKMSKLDLKRKLIAQSRKK